MNGDFNSLILKHKGKKICVMGGAGTLAEHLPQVDADLYISTNAHGVELQPPDYLLAMDEVNSREKCPMGPWLRSKCDAPIISPHAYADYQLMTWAGIGSTRTPRFVLSGMVATWAAFLMGAKVVILAGFDGYASDRPGKAHGYGLEAAKMARDVHCPVRVVGGGLGDVWPAYDPDEKFGHYKPHPSINGWLGIDERVRIRVVKSCGVRGAERKPGDELVVMRHEVKAQLKHRMVVEV